MKRRQFKPAGKWSDPEIETVDPDFDDADEIVHRHPTLFASSHPYGIKVRDFEQDPE